MTDHITVYAYNVDFGDGLLIEVPDGGTKRYILIDVGNVKGSAAPLETAIRDVHTKTNGHVDLYIMTHEHMDHVQGLKYAADKGVTLEIDHVWMTASADPNYYDNNQHPDARRKLSLLRDAADAFKGQIGTATLPESIAGIVELNLKSTDECVEFIRHAGKHRHYMHRESRLAGTHTFTEATLRILAPEEDTSDYYGRTSGAALAQRDPHAPGGTPAARPVPLAGVDAGAFYDLIDELTAGVGEAFLAIDKAANNTSLVVELSWRKRRLLFVGDAQTKSWQFMHDNGGLLPVDFLKVGHHGSSNATPNDAILDEVLPKARKSHAVAVVSTHDDAYNGVPDSGTLSRITSRTKKLHDTRSSGEGKAIAIKIAEGA